MLRKHMLSEYIGANNAIMGSFRTLSLQNNKAKGVTMLPKGKVSCNSIIYTSITFSKKLPVVSSFHCMYSCTMPVPDPGGLGGACLPSRIIYTVMVWGGLGRFKGPHDGYAYS